MVKCIGAQGLEFRAYLGSKEWCPSGLPILWLGPQHEKTRARQPQPRITFEALDSMMEFRLGVCGVWLSIEGLKDG